MKRAYYSNDIYTFKTKPDFEILGELTLNHSFSLDDLQKNAWIKQIKILKKAFCDFLEGHIIFEYTIPRMGKRIDNVLIYKGIVFIIEFKVGYNAYSPAAIEQVTDYALDLKNFHKESHHRLIIPLLVVPEMNISIESEGFLKDRIHNVVCTNSSMLGGVIQDYAERFVQATILADIWINSIYMPTPTIIEAAQVLYRGHDVKDISRNDATATNLSITTKTVLDIIENSKQNQRKSICFITGVPGAGKTLVGLNIANARNCLEDQEHAVFLSGNAPLVAVLQEALARDHAQREKIRKKDAEQKIKSFIQIIHHFRDDALSNLNPPIEKIAIFDEAQRAWDRENTSRFMKQKKGIFDFNKSEPEFLIEVMDRHNDWATVICLVGGGQEINTGEAGIIEWLESLKNHYPTWDVYLSSRITDYEYVKDHDISLLLKGVSYSFIDNLHLAVSLRSFRTEKLSEFVKCLIDFDVESAKELYQSLKSQYPIYLTRDLNDAKTWVRNHAKGSERYGMLASSGARRLKQDGICVQLKIEAANWFLNNKDDVRSSFFLEDTATEFDIQGLELDWTLVAWDINFHIEQNQWRYLSFTGTSWLNINSLSAQNYLKNAYRVLLTRARQGMVIYVPYGDEEDTTRSPAWYNSIYSYLSSIIN